MSSNAVWVGRDRLHIAIVIWIERTYHCREQQPAPAEPTDPNHHDQTAAQGPTNCPASSPTVTLSHVTALLPLGLNLATIVLYKQMCKLLSDGVLMLDTEDI